MQKTSNPSDEQRLEAYLDGLMNEAEQSAFQEQLRADNRLLQQVNLQGRIDDSVARLYPRYDASEEQLASLRDRLEAAPATDSDIAKPAFLPWKSLAALAAAATIAWILLSVWPQENPPLEPFFAPSPLAQIYTQTVDEGFEPYYECHEEDRFRETFLSRQGAPLRLKTLPVGSMMLGLSYPGGLSRETTAILCIQDEEPVMVFVDHAELDQPVAIENQDPSLNVFREVRDGLVFYEVTPFDEPTMIDFLVVESH